MSEGCFKGMRLVVEGALALTSEARKTYGTTRDEDASPGLPHYLFTTLSSPINSIIVSNNLIVFFEKLSARIATGLKRREVGKQVFEKLKPIIRQMSVRKVLERN